MPTFNYRLPTRLPRATNAVAGFRKDLRYAPAWIADILRQFRELISPLESPTKTRHKYS